MGTSRKTDTRQFWVYDGLRMYGPASMEVLATWVQEGRVNDDSRIAEHNTSAWRAATTYPELVEPLRQQRERIAEVMRQGAAEAAALGPSVIGYETAAPARLNALATVSMVFGIVGFVFCPMIFSTVGFVLGIIALVQIQFSGGRQRGRGQAITGVVLGFVGLAMVVLAIVAISMGRL